MRLVARSVPHDVRTHRDVQIAVPEHLPEMPALEGREITAPLPEDFRRMLSLLQLYHEQP